MFRQETNDAKIELELKLLGFWEKFQIMRSELLVKNQKPIVQFLDDRNQLLYVIESFDGNDDPKENGLLMQVYAYSILRTKEGQAKLQEYLRKSSLPIPAKVGIHFPLPLN